MTLNQQKNQQQKKAGYDFYYTNAYNKIQLLTSKQTLVFPIRYVKKLDNISADADSTTLRLKSLLTETSFSEN